MKSADEAVTSSLEKIQTARTNIKTVVGKIDASQLQDNEIPNV
jgi:hypothetical protein